MERVTAQQLMSRSSRNRAGVRPALAAALLILFAAAMALFYLWSRSHDFRTATQRAAELLADAHSSSEIEAALARWEEETGTAWRDQEDRYIEYLLDKKALESIESRRVLGYVSGADYGDRADDWKRWDAARKRIAAGGQPQTATREVITLGQRWTASVGLTSWYSTILPIDGKIFVASQGHALDDADDTADGVVLIDAKTPEAELIFQSPDKGPRDVLGLVAADGIVIAACRNGFVYGIERNGKLRWKAQCGAKIISPPLGFSVSGDGAVHVAVMTEAGRVVAIGPGGKTTWTTPIDLPARPKFAIEMIPAGERGVVRGTLAFGPLPPNGAAGVLVTTWHGLVMALSPANGKPLWNMRLPNGIIGGPVLLPPENDAQPGVYIGDVGGAVWSLLRADKRTTATAVWALGQRHALDGFAGLRSTIDSSGAAALLAVATDALGRGIEPRRSGLCLLTADGMRWRCPIEGEVRAAPAVADFNGDGSAESLVVSSLSGREGGSQTLLTFVSVDGFVLRRYAIDAAVHSSPAVGDVDGDGNLEILIADRAGILHCYTTEKFGVVNWGLVGGDPRGAHNAADAFTFSQTPTGYQAKWRPGQVKKR